MAEMRLYYYPPGSNTVEVLPIGIGQAGRETPRNWVTAVERKQEGPTVSDAEHAPCLCGRGKTLPAFVPAGPDNPMGLYAIYIGRLYAIRHKLQFRHWAAGERVVFVCVTTTLNIFSIMSPWAPACSLSIGPLR